MKVYTYSKYDYVKVVEIPKSEVSKVDFAMCQQPKETLSSFYNRQEVKPDVLINAGFFATSTGDSCFNVVDDGVVYSDNTKYKWGMGITADHKDIKYGCISMPSYGFVDFVSGYPNLVDGGISCAPWTFATEINYKALRTMLGYNDDTIYIVMVSKPGLTFNDMASLMIDIGCKYAVNLDGGGSSRCMVKGEVINVPTENRAVDSVFAVYLKENTPVYIEGKESDDYYIYTVIKGDSWWKIATTELGSGYLYTKLQEYNNWDTNKALQPGDEIKIPNDKFQINDQPSTDDSNNSNDKTNTDDNNNSVSPTIPDDSSNQDSDTEDDGNSETLICSMYINKSTEEIIYRDNDGNELSRFKF